MSTDPWDLLDAASTVVAFHAHPDDEALATGALLTALTARGTRVILVTATRGEEGEIVPGTVANGEQQPLEEIREGEIAAATAALGIAERHWLGTAPALAPDAAPRRYRDSGMQWVRPGLAGPADTAGEDSFTHRPLDDAAADLAALLQSVQPDVLLSYDDEGTYGHPDHVRAHLVARAASEMTDVPFVQVASDPQAAQEVREHPGTAEAVHRALSAYRTQLTVVDPAPASDPASESIPIRHVGGQDDAVPLATGLRPLETSA